VEGNGVKVQLSGLYLSLARAPKSAAEQNSMRANAKHLNSERQIRKRKFIGSHACGPELLF